MSSIIFPPIPFETAKAAQAVFGSSNYYLVIGDQAEALFDGLRLENLFGLPQITDHKLAALYLITVFQHVEALPDLLVAEALHERVEWKYALHFSSRPVHFDASFFCEFRKMIAGNPAGSAALQTLVGRLADIKQVALCQCLSQDPDQIVAHVCRISRLAKIWDAIKHALGSLATQNPEWLRTNSLPHWYERYGHIQKNVDLRAGQPEHEAFAQSIGSDGFHLLTAITSSGQPDLADIPEVLALRRIWIEQFELDKGQVTWRSKACAGCSLSSWISTAAWEFPAR